MQLKKQIRCFTKGPLERMRFSASERRNQKASQKVRRRLRQPLMSLSTSSRWADIQCQSHLFSTFFAKQFSTKDFRTPPIVQSTFGQTSFIDLQTQLQILPLNGLFPLTSQKTMTPNAQTSPQSLSSPLMRLGLRYSTSHSNSLLLLTTLPGQYVTSLSRPFATSTFSGVIPWHLRPLLLRQKQADDICSRKQAKSASCSPALLILAKLRTPCQYTVNSLPPTSQQQRGWEMFGWGSDYSTLNSLQQF